MAAHPHQLARPGISQAEFVQFQRFIYNAAGITLSDAKKALVSGRLAKRLAHCGVASYGEYFRLLDSGAHKDEVQEAIDLLTTNETYFFREAKHFDLLRERALSPQRPRGETFRVWSAACSSGEECYSIAMVLAECLGERPWEIMGSDICTKVLHKARIGHYPMERARHIPQPLLRKYCLKGQDAQEGTMLVESSLRRRVQFGQINLNTALPQLGQFDMVFLRNVMIYFNGDTKRQVVDRIGAQLKPHGCLVIGLAESLSDSGAMVKPVAPSVYVRA
ncbi:protein-glutamate O-methyltransferase CheR [Massilia violaceinigra]|uniref:Chemotaxis protein methyltransferase n=1 Tax=Massilia violaceinigra TaxID=2045208 RepID=A0ABY4A750_9BURK|nr:protein-glutamate O-methyltransferase CheR [Massilia violaceinigra]UOD29829.1 protein-glutamate O-methyltransferase CheR [Massilia violaceinigra]